MPQSLVEAVAIDGGNAFHKLIYVTIPMVTPTIFFNFLMGMINHLQNFIPVYAITQGGPNNATLFTVYYLVREAFTRNNFGYASAIAVVFFVVISIITAIIFVTSKKCLYRSAGSFSCLLACKKFADVGYTNVCMAIKILAFGI